MLKELSTLMLFFKDPLKTYSAREIARATKINHITVAKRLKQYPFIVRKDHGPYLGFFANTTPEFTRLRLMYNYMSLFDCGLFDFLVKEYNYPTLVLFGSYATATNISTSDIDILIISENTQSCNTKVFETRLGHKIQLFIHTRKELLQLKLKSPHLVNSWCNGMVLTGELEVFE